MTEEYRYGGMRALNEEGWDATAGSGVEPEVSGRVEVGRRRWLEQEGAYHVPHYILTKDVTTDVITIDACLPTGSSQ
jgi:hypothetical protein